MAKLLVAMSGGVDSSVALSLLLEAGHTLEGITFTIDDSVEARLAVKDAAACAQKFGIPHRVLDISAEFDRHVKEYFVFAYEKGLTPNPCVVCNREIKFGLLVDYAKKNGFDGVATGHYARLAHENGRTKLLRARDSSKDQSYMLAAVPETALALAHFPLGEYTKDEIRQMAEKLGLPTAGKKDSQDICFVPGGDYVGFIEAWRGRSAEAGDYVDTDGNILGRHKGQCCYTIGQRKGLGIALGRHMFVLSKDAETNRVVLGDSAGLMKPSVTLTDVNYIGRDGISDGEELECKIRYAHRAAKCEVFNKSEGKLEVKFAENQRAPSPGQLAVIYDGDEVAAAGVIE